VTPTYVVEWVVEANTCSTPPPLPLNSVCASIGCASGLSIPNINLLDYAYHLVLIPYPIKVLNLPVRWKLGGDDCPNFE
jgi:hypothetical protein